MITQRLGFSDQTDAEKTSCLTVGEVAQAHDGSLGMAHAYIDAIEVITAVTSQELSGRSWNGPLNTIANNRRG